MARRSDHTREQLEEMILEAAWRIVGEEGAQALTARRVASAIGYTPGTIYNLFESMDALCLRVNGRTLDLLYEILSDPACQDSGKSPLENMKVMAGLYEAFARDYKPYWFMLFSHAVSEDQRRTDWYREKISRLFTPLETLLRPLFSEGAGDEQRKQAARILWSSVHGLCFLQETGKMDLVGEAVGMRSTLIETLFAGFQSRNAL